MDYSIPIMTAMAVYMSVIYYLTKRSETQAELYKKEAERSKELGEKSYQQAKELNELKNKRQPDPMDGVHVQFVEGNFEDAPDELKDAIRQMVTLARGAQTDGAQCQCPHCTMARELNVEPDLIKDIDRLKPRIQEMTVDEIMDWCDAAADGFIERAIPIFIQMEMKEQALVMQGYLNHKFDNDNG